MANALSFLNNYSNQLKSGAANSGAPKAPAQSNNSANDWLGNFLGTGNQHGGFYNLIHGSGGQQAAPTPYSSDTYLNKNSYAPQPANLPSVTLTPPGSGGKGTNPGAFVPTYLNGQLYNNVGELNQAEQNALTQQQQNTAAQANQPIQYNGQQYNNYHDYNQAVLGDISKTHQQAVSQATKAYQDGLISFDEKNKAIDLSRQNAQQNYTQSTQALGNSHTDSLASNSNYFSNASPYAYQSQQGVHEGKINDAYNQSINNLNTQNQQNNDALNQNQSDLANTKGNFQTDYTNNLAALNKNYQGSLDQSANAENAYNNGQTQTANANAAAMTNLIDQQNNAGIAAANASAKYASSAGSKQVQLTPFDIQSKLSGIVGASAGYGLDPTTVAGQYLNQQGFSSAQAAPYLAYWNGQANPNGQAQSGAAANNLYTAGTPGA